MDQVCVLDVDNPACAKDVEFYALLHDWGYYNILGLAPVNGREAPNLIRMLEQQGVIDAQRATIRFSPLHFVAVDPTLTLGKVPDGFV